MRPAFGERTHEVNRGRIGPVKVLEDDDRWLRARSGQDHIGHRSQLPASQGLGREFGRALRRQRNVYQWREKGRVFRVVEADQPQRVLKISEALLGRGLHTKSKTAPIGQGMQGRVLEQLRGAPFHPGVRRLSQLRMKLVQQPRLAQAWLADDYH